VLKLFSQAPPSSRLPILVGDETVEGTLEVDGARMAQVREIGFSVLVFDSPRVIADIIGIALPPSMIPKNTGVHASTVPVLGTSPSLACPVKMGSKGFRLRKDDADIKTFLAAV
jgi:hypothetical protein